METGLGSSCSSAMAAMQTPLSVSSFFSRATTRGKLARIASFHSDTDKSVCQRIIIVYTACLHGSVSPAVLHLDVHLAGLDEELDATEMVLGARDVQRRPSVVVAHIHVQSREEGPFKCNLVAVCSGKKDLVCEFLQNSEQSQKLFPRLQT